MNPQTSGGLLGAVDQGSAERVLAELRSEGYNAQVIGEVTAKGYDIQ